jgi:hypothetical protein
VAVGPEAVEPEVVVDSFFSRGCYVNDLRGTLLDHVGVG